MNALADVKHTRVTLVSIRSLTRAINTQVTITREAEVLEQETALEVLVGMQNGVELAGIPQIFVFDLFKVLACCSQQQGT